MTVEEQPRGQSRSLVAEPPRYSFGVAPLSKEERTSDEEAYDARGRRHQPACRLAVAPYAGSQVPITGNSARRAERRPSRHAHPPGRRVTLAWRQAGVVLVLLSSDALLAALVWLAAYELQGTWGRWNDYPMQTAMVVGVFVMAGLWSQPRFLHRQGRDGHPIRTRLVCVAGSGTSGPHR